MASIDAALAACGVPRRALLMLGASSTKPREVFEVLLPHSAPATAPQGTAAVAAAAAASGVASQQQCAAAHEAAHQAQAASRARPSRQQRLCQLVVRHLVVGAAELPEGTAHTGGVLGLTVHWVAWRHTAQPCFAWYGGRDFAWEACNASLPACPIQLPAPSQPLRLPTASLLQCRASCLFCWRGRLCLQQTQQDWQMRRQTRLWRCLLASQPSASSASACARARTCGCCWARMQKQRRSDRQLRSSSRRVRGLRAARQAWTEAAAAATQGRGRQRRARCTSRSCRM